jgi:RNA polymerase sigma-70 factor (ECF subfamily)
MNEDPQHGVTQLLKAWGDGDQRALDQLTPLVVHELKRLAHRCMLCEHGQHTLQTTGLVNEAYLQLVDINGVRWQDRTHFYSLAARIMRRIMIEEARTRMAAKRGGDAIRITFDEALPIVSKDSEFVALDEALRKLAMHDARKAQMVELRFFGGLSVEETALVLEVSEQTIHRDWRLARSWLLRELKSQAANEAAE